MSKQRLELVETDDKGNQYPARLVDTASEVVIHGWGYDMVLKIDEAGTITGHLSDTAD